MELDFWGPTRAEQWHKHARYCSVIYIGFLFKKENNILLGETFWLWWCEVLICQVFVPFLMRSILIAKAIHFDGSVHLIFRPLSKFARLHRCRSYAILKPARANRACYTLHNSLNQITADIGPKLIGAICSEKDKALLRINGEVPFACYCFVPNSSLLP